MHEETTEGIVLRSQDYKERHRIITLFSPQGLISLIVKGISRKNAHLLSLTTPFCQGEYHFRRTTSDLFSFRDGTILDEHLILRRSLTSLQTAGTLANIILQSQFPGKPAPALFALYKSYHKQVPHFSDPTPLITSFYLKLLQHEGVLSLETFSPAESQLLLPLHTATHFSSLLTLSIPPPLSQKIEKLFALHLT